MIFKFINKLILVSIWEKYENILIFLKKVYRYICVTICIYVIGVACYTNSFISVVILKISYIKVHIKAMNCIGKYCLPNSKFHLMSLFLRVLCIVCTFLILYKTPSAAILTYYEIMQISFCFSSEKKIQLFFSFVAREQCILYLSLQFYQ